MRIVITESQAKHLIEDLYNPLDNEVITYSNRIEPSEDIDEQNILDRIKSTAQKVGSKIQTGVNQVNDKVQAGVNQVANKVANATQPQQPKTSIQQPTGQTLEQVRAEWMKVNSDTSNTKGFGEGTSKDEHGAMTMAQMNGRVAIMKKMGKTNGYINASIVEQKQFNDPDGTIHFLVIMDIN